MSDGIGRLKLPADEWLRILAKDYERRSEMKKGLEQAADTITALQSRVPRWIPVGEALPERDTECVKGGVLALHETGEIYHCRRAWNGQREVWAHAFVDAGISDDRFTHWMPLPTPPEDSNDG